MDPIRSLVAVLGSLLLLAVLDQLLEMTLVSAMAQGAISDMTGYLAVRNRPGILSVLLVAHGFASVLAGYMAGKIAAAWEAQHAGISAALFSAMLAWQMLVSDGPGLPPTWYGAAMLAVTAPAMLAGAWIRSQARTILSDEAAGPRPEERS